MIIILQEEKFLKESKIKEALLENASNSLLKKGVKEKFLFLKEITEKFFGNFENENELEKFFGNFKDETNLWNDPDEDVLISTIYHEVDKFTFMLKYRHYLGNVFGGYLFGIYWKT